MAEREGDPVRGPRRADLAIPAHPAADRRTGILLAGPAPPRLPGQAPRLPGQSWPGTRPNGPDGPPGPRERAARASGAPERGAARPGGYNPALDGIRALAVLCVLVFHMDSLPGGYLGVDVFFVLSGFLITGQLLAEWDRTGAVSLRRFYLRRAYRLLPAFWLLALVGFTVVVLLGVGTAGERAEFLGSLTASLLYVNNYVQVVRQSTGAGWLGHTWSLSLEEQFYLLWPLVLVALCRRPRLARRLPMVLLGGAAVVVLWRIVLIASGASATRMYFALDTRADALLVGCALAAWLRAARRGPAGENAAAFAWRRRLDRVTPFLPVAGPAALALLAVAAMTAPSGWGPRPTALSYGGYTVVALLAGAVVLAVEQGRGTNWLFRALAAPPLAWLGRISYGFYLWHFPVVAYWGRDLTGEFGRWPAILAVGVLSVVLAAASYYLLERPVLRRRPADPPPRPPRASPPRRQPALAAVTGDGGDRGSEA
ncbi:acyltransferase [Frankia sp. CNm7]|uniref:Acyltransferase n=1 Tax=Frankia nepalensis TaxID=1836974 RepID=A0A937USP0_9ACTN|nr:acyltransferase [Frankia nepalensis]MBL7498559.1 acyltransferase [Frankia nepalensis]MBL7508723.1 acyltransferase [Frankia nepalensis]MBL7522458.1 acyltransferase [Frankia nepalensis]MBL7629086.1 acyltransferase [Frankia nepalensis]